MAYIVVLCVLLALIYGPFLWVRFVLWRYLKNIARPK
jgi:hypothetical protein